MSMHPSAPDGEPSLRCEEGDSHCVHATRGSADSSVDEPRVPLNTALHWRIARDGTARASTLPSALAALHSIRSARRQKNSAP